MNMFERVIGLFLVSISPHSSLVSGLNATDKTPMYEMLLIYVVGVSE